MINSFFSAFVSMICTRSTLIRAVSKKLPSASTLKSNTDQGFCPLPLYAVLYRLYYWGSHSLEFSFNQFTWWLTESMFATNLYCMNLTHLMLMPALVQTLSSTLHTELSFKLKCCWICVGASNRTRLTHGSDRSNRVYWPVALWILLIPAAVCITSYC